MKNSLIKSKTLHEETMKIIFALLLLILAMPVMAQDTEERGHSTSLMDGDYYLENYHQIYFTARDWCFACSDMHKLEFIETQCPLDKSYPPKCGNRHFAMYCNRTGMYYVALNYQFAVKMDYKVDSIRAYEISGYGHKGVLDLDIIGEKLIMDVNSFGIKREKARPQEMADMLDDKAYSCRVVRR